MGCVAAKQSVSKRRQQQQRKQQIENPLEDCSIDAGKKRYNPDLMKNGCRASELNDFSLCAIESKKRGNFDDIEEQVDEFNNSYDDEKNTNSSKSEEQGQESPKQVIPAQMQLNWQLQNNIGESSLLQRRFIHNKLKSNCEISSNEQ